MVECGGAHTIIKSYSNELYAFGLNDKGQLGFGVVGNFSSIPHKLQRFTSFPIMKISCSEESSCLLTSNGDLYVWGRNTEGMFDSNEGGIFAMDQPIDKPTLVSKKL
jgi:alpha-tubulin suppressor-like RCC1 family protein